MMKPLTEQNQNNPVTKATIVLLCCALLIALTYFGKSVVIPILFAILAGIVLRPVEKFFNQKLKIPRVIALLLTLVLLTLVLFMLLISGIIAFVTYEFTRFMEDLPQLKKNLRNSLISFQAWVSVNTGIQYATQQEYINNATEQGMANPGMIAQQTLATLGAIFTAAVVFPVLLFLTMFYRPLFLNFLLKVFGEEQRACVTSIIGDVKYAMQGYIAGLFLEMLTVTVLQTIAMWIVGVKYFVFIGLITGVLNMIPYIGIMIAGLMGILISYATGGDGQQVLFLILGFACVQFIDNNILLPNLVGHRVRINAFFSIVGVIAGGLIAGVAGMFLAIPLMAIMKVIFDNVPRLKPWGELMGDEMPRIVKWKHLNWPRMH
jgi:predicted PurR-regulated permease PerM